MNLVKRIISVLALLTLAACGGGGNGAGDPPFGGVDGGGSGGGNGGGSTPTASDIVLVLNAASIANDGSETITATATALNGDRNAVAGVPLVISVNNNAVATTNSAVTNEAGIIEATIGIGSDNSNRVIIVTATSGSIVKQTSLEVRDPVAGGVGAPVLQVALSSTSISAASPANVTATLRDVRGAPVSGVVIEFEVPRGLAQTNVPTALTNDAGQAFVVLSPSASTSAGADEIIATTTYAGSSLSETRGFQVQATNVTISSFSAASNPLSAYGQTPLTIRVTGASTTTPVNMSVTSACVAQGKATVSPSTFSTTSGTVTLQYRDNGCGALDEDFADQLQVVVDGTGTSRSLALRIDAPAAASLAFVNASPEEIYLRGSGFTENSTVTFEVRDAAGNPLPGRTVELRLQTGAGGVTMEGRGVESINPPSADPFTQASNAQGRVSVRINSGTQPTPVRVNAKLQDTTISTVSSNLSVATGLPAQLSFSLSQTTRNIEGYNIDGTANQYNIIAADRSGNPVPVGTSINFVAEGGQIQAIRQIQLVNGIARTTANYVSSGTRPVDGRVTITAYALGEESFIDLNGNNIYSSGEPFQDLGNVFLDRNFDGVFDDTVDEFIPLNINNSRNCAPITNNLLALDNSIPSAPATCSGNWSGAGQVYVRRAAETVLSTSAARPLWLDTRGLSNTCLNNQITLQIGPDVTQTADFTLVGGDTWYGDASGTISLIVADANPGNAALGLPPRLNPMAAGTVITATTPTTGFNVTLGGGTPVASTTEATSTAVAYNFTDPAVQSAVIFVTFRSPSGTGTTVAVSVSRDDNKPSDCPV